MTMEITEEKAPWEAVYPKTLDGKNFEKVVKWWLENDPVYRSQLKAVWLWDEWPGRDGVDIGVDLVAETQDGELWAIQAKNFSPDQKINKKEVTSFVTGSQGDRFSFRLLVASTDLVSRTVERIFKDAGVAFVGRTGLIEADLDWDTLRKGSRAKAPAKPHKPRPHQKRAVKAVLKGFESHSRGQLLMACGTGKTLVAQRIKEGLGARNTLVLVPTLSLVKQLVREWTRDAETEDRYLVVCSDATTKPGPDELIESTADFGFPVTTDSAVIAEFLRKRGPKVIISTYQSSPVIREAQEASRVPSFDLTIADEAHRTAGVTTGNAFSTLLDEEKIRSKNRLFMTATPRIYSYDKKKAGGVELTVASMDDESLFGPVLHSLSFASAVEQGLLCDYQVVVPLVAEDQTFDLLTGEGTVVAEGLPELGKRNLTAALTVLNAARKRKLSKILSFHSRVATASEFATLLKRLQDWLPKRLRDTRDISAESVYGRLSAGKRQAAIDRLATADEGEISILTSARCLTEGVDVPAIDGVAFIDPKQSQVDIVQAVGRAMRRNDESGKKVGTIVIPVVVDTYDGLEEELEGSAFRHVWGVIRGLSAHDETLAEELRQRRSGLGKGKRSQGLPPRLVFEIPDLIAADVVEKIEIAAIRSTTRAWEEGFAALEAFVAREGHARVPVEHFEAEYKLGTWVVTQRSEYRVGRLSRDRVIRLQSLDGWVWDVREAQWEEGFAALEAFVAREGHARVPAAWKEGSFALGSWVGKQRSQKVTGTLTEDRIAQLEHLDGWVWDVREAQWEEGFAALEAFVAREGHARVPKTRVENGFKLGSWVMVIRSLKRKGLLSPERKDRLKSLDGWVWDAREAQWEEGFAALEAFVAREGHARVPRGGGKELNRLASWVTTQRTKFRSGSLSKKRIERLENLDGWVWDVNSAKWEEGFAALEAFVAREGHARVPAAWKEGSFALGSWVTGQRSAKRLKKISEERIKRLESLEGWEWQARDQGSELALSALEAFVAREGHARVPDGWKEGDFKLGIWVGNQRSKKRNGKLSREKITQLEAFDGWVWDVNSAKWEEGFAALEAFVAREGHARVPQDWKENGLSLGSWVGTQRALRRDGKLPDDRVNRLEEFDGWVWDAREAQWEEGFAALEAFVAREGHARVPDGFTEDGFRLASWVQAQRRREAKGKISDERTKRLEQLDGWVWDVREAQWEEGFAALEAFVAREGHARVPRRASGRDARLAVWITSQRRRFQTGSLSEEKIKRLENLEGWAWNVKETQWEDTFEVLRVFVAREGHARVPAAWKEGSVRLGAWVANQRFKKRRGQLSKDRIKLLEKLPRWTWGRPEAKGALDQSAAGK